MRIKRILTAGVVCTAAAVGSRHYAQAAPEGIRSNGSIVYEDGDEVAVYSEDIRYLQNEMNRLFEELGQ